MFTTIIKPTSILLLVLFAVACTSEETSTDRPEREGSVEIRPDVVFVKTDGEPLYRYLESSGVVEPVRDLTIQPRISGFLEWHQIADGRRVQQGDTLLRIIQDEWRLRYLEAENAYLRASQEYRIERELRERDGRTSRQSSDSESGEFTERDARILQQQTGYLQAQIAFDRAKLDLTYTSVIAPFSGVIHTNLNLSDGAYINAGHDLGKLLDHRSVRVRLDVLESELARVREGMDVEITTATGYKTTGRVRTISPMINRDRKTGQIVVDVVNREGNLRTGMTVNGRILTETHSGRLRAPRSVLLERDGRQLVFKLSGEMVEWVYVEPAIITPEYIILNEEALQAGDTLAYDRHFALSHQQRINTRMRN
ncbi:MAG: efflux RND transporter periplasmic adaptor subunit [Balneolales bacterium]|nr:efflux RND transporter periplasmic adaptor subunit [Balneolales bacterium]